MALPSRRLVVSQSAPASVVAGPTRPAVEGLEGRELLAAQPALQLINAATDRAIGELKDGSTIDMAEVGSKLNIRAVPTGKVGSVVFKIDGRRVNTESFTPYAIGGNDGNDYRDWTPPTGRHTLQVTLYNKANGKGTAIATRSIGFTVSGTAVVDPPPPVTPPPVPPPPTVPPPVPSDDGGNDPVPGTVDEPGSPTAVIKLIGQSGVAGHPVVVDAVDSDLPNSPLYARYQWDFGDPDGRYNRLPGWTAGHIYDQPGTYTVRLTVTDGNGNADTAEATITVFPDDRRTVYVDAENGSDGNDGSAESPIRSFDAAARYAGRGNVRVLFHRGQQWDTRGWMSVTGDSVMVGAYGEGANPVLNVVSGKCAIRSFESASNLLIENLTFDSPYKPVGADADKMDANGIYLGGTGVAVRDCTFLNVTDGINSNGQPHGMIVMDNDAPSTTGIRGYLCWTEGTDIVIVGNSAANSTREHIVRIKDGNKLLLAYNDFTNLSRESVDKQDIRKGCIEMQRGSWAYIYGNTTRMGPIRVGPRGENTEPGNTTTRYAVVENNKIYDYKINLYPGAQHVMIRDNVMYANNAPAIALNPIDPQGRHLIDINIVDNVAYNTAANGQFLRSGSGLLPGTVTVGRNTYVAPNLAGGVNGNAPIYVLSGDLAGFKRIFDNTWPLPATNIKYAQGGVMWVSNGYTGQAGFKDPTEWLAYPQVDGDVFRDF